MSRPKPHDGRGRHRRATSPETHAWNRHLREKDWLQPEARVEQPKPAPAVKPKPTPLPPAPAQPAWLDAAEYEALLELRRRL
jgi:hypothetical protein